MKQSVKIEIPWCSDLSKNKKYCSRNFVLSPAYRKAKNGLTLYFKSQLQKNKVKFVDKNKLKISAFFTRPNMKMDIQNFQEAFCDCIQDAAKVNDRYFSFGEWDWVFDKKSHGKIVLTIEQDDDSK